MIYWIVLCNVWINFVLGALIPITPKLNEQMAGVAFSAFAFMKVVVFIPSGIISDRLGHFTGFFIALLAQVLTIALIIYYPNYVWISRTLEGITLAFGTVSALSLFRVYSSNVAEFSRSISMLLGIGSSGFLLGPFFGYNFELSVALEIIFKISCFFAVVHLLLFRLHKSSIRGFSPEAGNSSKVVLPLVLAFALAKGLGVGTEPLFGWWAIEKIKLGPVLAGVTFVCAAIGFMAGNFRPKLSFAYLGFVGILFLELSLSGAHFLWWPAMIFLGIFSGVAINICISKLGWNKPDNIGFKNSKWLALSDIPMMLTPALLWPLRDQSTFWLSGFAFSATMLVVLALIKKQTNS